MKEVEVLGLIMGHGVHPVRMRQPIAIMIILCFLLQLVTGFSQAEVKNYRESWDGDITVVGGRTVLVEELSTTWCTGCAEIDPYLQQVADAHGSRITIVTYHPTDDDDAFQPPAADHRIQRMKLINPQLGSTPAFVVESGQLRIGPDSWPDVQKDILKAETNRQEVSEVSFTISQDGYNYTATIENVDLMNVGYETQLTFMLMNHEVEVPDGYSNPGEKHRDRVIVATASCKIDSNSTHNIGFSESKATNCAEDFTVDFSNEGKFSLVLIHEATDEVLQSNPNLSSTLGVVEFAYRDIEIDNQTNILPIVFVSAILIGFIWVVIDKKVIEKSVK